VTVHLVAGAHLNDLLELYPRFEGQIVNLVAGIADEMVVLFRLDEAETGLAGAEGQFA
jgi:hypothetical protein